MGQEPRVTVARQQRQVTMLKVTDDDLLRHESLAYQDGYADARDHGQEGFWLNPEYGAYARERYMDAFKKGMRVYRVQCRQMGVTFLPDSPPDGDSETL